MKIQKLLATDKVLALAGTWVWTPGGELATDTYARFRRTFNLDALPARATITVANTCGEYEMRVNGQWAGRGGCPSTPEVHYADTHRIKRFLQPGKNVIAILAHGYGAGGQWWTFSPSGLIAEVKAGKNVLLGTDASWKCCLAPEFSRRAHRFLFFLGFAEIVDLRDEQPDWIKLDFDDYAWPAAEPCKELGSHALIPRETALPASTYFPAKPSGTGKWLCPEGIQSIYMPPIVKHHGTGRYRLTSYAMSTGYDTKLSIQCDADYVVKINGKEIAHKFGAEGAVLDRYTEASYRVNKWDLQAPPDKVRLEPGWNEVAVELDADERTAYVALIFTAHVWLNVMPLRFSATKDPASPGWRVEKLDVEKLDASGTKLYVQADGLTAEVHSAWDISLPARGGKLPRKDVPVQPGRYVIFDLGRVMSGRPAIEATAPSGTVLDLQYAEWISDYDKPLQAAGDRYVDRITWREGRHTRQTVARRGVRFVKVFNRGGFPGDPARAHAGTAIVHNVWAAVEKVVGKPSGSFECSDPLLNRIYKTSVDTLDISLNYQLVDCATRENGQYPGDAYVQAQQFFYLYNDLRILRKGIRQFPRVQEDSGRFSGMTPAEWRHTLTDYCLIWVSWLADHYRHTADLDLACEMMPCAEKLFGFFRAMKDADHGLLERTSDEYFWVFLDHSPIHKKGLVCGYNAWYARALEDAAYLAGELQQPDLAKKYAGEAAAIRAAARQLFWDGSAGLYRDCWAGGAPSPSITFQTNVIALFTGLATDDQMKTMPAKMWRPDGSKIQPELTLMNPYFQHYVLEALAKAGKHDWALSFIRDYWGLMLDCGATTTWETFQSTGPVLPASSLCHPWSGAPAYWLPAYVLGVKCAAPGWRKAMVRPQATIGVDSARGAVPTPHGPISVEWQRKHGEIELVRCDAPEGVEVMGGWGGGLMG